MTEQQLDEMWLADHERRRARERATDIGLGLHKTPRRSRDNVGTHDGHKAGTYRRQPRTSYSNPALAEGTSSHMIVTLADGSKHTVPAIPKWRNHVKSRTVVIDHTPDTARIGGSQADYD